MSIENFRKKKLEEELRSNLSSLSDKISSIKETGKTNIVTDDVGNKYEYIVVDGELKLKLVESFDGVLHTQL